MKLLCLVAGNVKRIGNHPSGANVGGGGYSTRGRFKFVGWSRCRSWSKGGWCTHLLLQVFLQCRETYLNFGGNINMELEAESLLAIFTCRKGPGQAQIPSSEC